VAAYFVLAPAAVAWSIIGLTWAAKSADARHSGVSHECVSSQAHALLDKPPVGKVADVTFLLPARGDCRGEAVHCAQLCSTTVRAKQSLILAATVAGAHTHDPGVSHPHDRIPGAIPGSRRLQLLLLLFDWGIENW
jgi:hypothetical protein